MLLERLGLFLNKCKTPLYCGRYIFYLQGLHHELHKSELSKLCVKTLERLILKGSFAV